MSETRTEIAFLGTGLLGFPMARRLAAAGVPLTVWNRTRAKAERLAGDGASVATAPEEAVAAGAAVILMLADFPAIREVLLAAPVLDRLGGRTVIQMGTIGPGESRQLAGAVVEAGGEYLEAPVLGSVPQAEAGELIVMAGGPEPLYRRWQPMLERFGRSRLVGPVGRAAALKLALNQLIATLSAAYATGLAMVRAEGADLDTFIEIVRASALYAPTFDKKLPRMLSGDYANPNFPARHLLKDLRLCRDLAAADEIATEVLEGIERILERTVAAGLGDADYSALAATVAGPRGARPQ